MMNTERGWLSVSESAKYVGISSDVVRQAIASGDLVAYEKPISRGRKAQNAENQHHYYKISRNDLDAWVRSWPRA